MFENKIKALSDAIVKINADLQSKSVKLASIERFTGHDRYKTKDGVVWTGVESADVQTIAEKVDYIMEELMVLKEKVDKLKK